MIRAVLDTNMLVSAILTDGPAAAIMRASRDGRFAHVTSGYILDESRRVMTVKLGLTPSDVDDVLLRVAAAADVQPLFSANRRWCGDAGDDAVVETAVRGAADCLVTGDRLLLRAAIDEMRIVSVREFVDLLGI